MLQQFIVAGWRVYGPACMQYVGLVLQSIGLGRTCAEVMSIIRPVTAALHILPY